MAKYVHNYISVLEKDYKLSDGKINKSIFPPQQSFQMGSGDKVVEFTAFSRFSEYETGSITVKQVNTMLKQRNYTNIYVSILGEQIMSLQERIDKLTLEIQKLTKKDNNPDKVRSKLLPQVSNLLLRLETLG